MLAISGQNEGGAGRRQGGGGEAVGCSNDVKWRADRLPAGSCRPATRRLADWQADRYTDFLRGVCADLTQTGQIPHILRRGRLSKANAISPLIFLGHPV